MIVKIEASLLVNVPDNIIDDFRLEANSGSDMINELLFYSEATQFATSVPFTKITDKIIECPPELVARIPRRAK